jgi:hypothetical protein
LIILVPFFVLGGLSSVINAVGRLDCTALDATSDKWTETTTSAVKWVFWNKMPAMSDVY